MFKNIMLGVWICMVAFGSLISSMLWQGGSNAAKPPAEAPSYKVTNVLSIPVVSNNITQGYVLVQLGYVVDSAIEHELSIPVEPLVNDATFRLFWGSYSDTRALERIDIDAISSELQTQINSLVSRPLIKQLVIGQFNYVSSKKIRSTFLKPQKR